MRKKLHTAAFYTLLLAVYGIFFSVESFYNFEGHSNAKEIFSASAVVHFSGQHTGFVKATPLQSSSKHGIRLNKRYHQEEMAPCPEICVPVPELPLIPRVLGSYPVVSLPSIAVIHHPLRGPPVVA